MKRLARADKRDPVTGIPPILGMRIVVVQPPLAIIAVDLEDVRVAVGVDPFMRVSVRSTAFRILSRLNLIRHNNGLNTRTKYFHFLIHRGSRYR